MKLEYLWHNYILKEVYENEKILSILLAAMLAFSALGATSMMAFAASNTVASPEHTTRDNDKIGQVNGKVSDDVDYQVDPTDPTKISFTYTGNGDFQNWQFPGMTEGKDYKVISVDGNTITIQLINGYEGDVIGNAIVNFQGETTTKRAPRKDNKSNSPKTGATMATGLALAGAGAAVLAAMKKNRTLNKTNCKSLFAIR